MYLESYNTIVGTDLVFSNNFALDGTLIYAEYENIIEITEASLNDLYVNKDLIQLKEFNTLNIKLFNISNVEKIAYEDIYDEEM